MVSDFLIRLQAAVNVIQKRHPTMPADEVADHALRLVPGGLDDVEIVPESCDPQDVWSSVSQSKLQ